MAESLLHKIKRTTRLPSPPGTAMHILELCQREDPDVGELADTLAADPALSLRLLKYANSPLVGVARTVTNVRQAVVLLGIRSVRLMALSFSLVTAADRRACRGFDYGQFWSHSVACAVAARHLAKRAKLPPEEAFVSGLLAHIGKLVFAVCLPDTYSKVLSAAEGKLGETTAFEPEQMGSSHAQLGADLIVDWAIPGRLAEVVRHHVAPEAADDAGVASLARVVHVAAAIADTLCGAVSEERIPERRAVLPGSGLVESQEQAAEVVQQIREEFSELASVLSLSEGTVENAEELQAEAGEVLGELSLATQLKSEAVEEENRGLQQKAWTDALTGVNNRAAFDSQLQTLWDQSAQNKRSIALIMLDVDHFKKFNDAYGHQTGDEVLKSVGACLPRSVRSVDFAARYGGEEFAVIVPNADRLTVAQICVKIRKAIETMVVDFGSQQHRVTVSVGAALLPVVASPFTPEKLIEAADKQLYASKQKGRNCCSMKQLLPVPTETAVLQPAPA